MYIYIWGGVSLKIILLQKTITLKKSLIFSSFENF